MAEEGVLMCSLSVQATLSGGTRRTFETIISGGVVSAIGIRKDSVKNRQFTILYFFQKITVAVTERPKGAEVLQWALCYARTCKSSLFLFL